MSTQPIIELEQVTKKYEDEVAVKGVDLAMEPGEFLCLLGPSGCGKTTILRLIAGLETPDGGTILIGGQHMAEGGKISVPAQKRGVGMVFQDYALFPHLDVDSNVGFGLSDAPQCRERVAETLCLVGLADLRDRMPHQLSGGQQQRAALARALAPRPQVVLLDEPFSNLDASLRARLRIEVRNILTRAGISVIFVSHDQQEAFSLADRVAVMMDGQILQTAHPQRLYRLPASKQVASFIGEANFLPAKLGLGIITCELGGFTIADAEAGPEVQVMFRPEDLRLTPKEDGTARVSWNEYLGHDQRTKIELPSGRKLLARSHSERTFKAGDRVDISVLSPPIIYDASGDLTDLQPDFPPTHTPAGHIPG